MVELEPIRLSRQLARVESARRQWELRLKSAPDIEDNPFGVYRELLSADQFAATQELPDLDPLKPHLLRWLFKLIERRVNHQGHTLLHYQRYGERYALERSEAQLSLAQILGRALADAPQRERWLKALKERSSPLAETAGLLRQRRVEVAERLKLDSVDSLEHPQGSLEDEAHTWLTRTQPLVEESPTRGWNAFIQNVLDPDAGARWPTRADERSIAHWFREARLLDDLNLQTPPLPQALAPASFLRALELLGNGIQRACAPESQPFVVAQDPYELSAHSLGALLSLLPFNAAFCSRELEVAKSAIAQHRRLLARVILTETRIRAIKVLLRQASLHSQKQAEELFQELTAKHLRVEFGPSLLGVVLRLGEDDTQRFAGPFLASIHNEALVHAHDEDWYRNPRAVDQLRSEAQLPPNPEVDVDAVKQGQDLLLSDLNAALN